VTVLQLLEASADVERRGGYDQSTPLHVAARLILHNDYTGNHGLQFAQMLLDYGADVTASTKIGETLLHAAAGRTGPGGGTATAELLLQHGADVSSVTKNGRMPLHCAASVGDGAIVSLLLEKGADATAKADDGETPLHAIARGGCIQQFEACSYGMYPEEYGIDEDDANVTRLLLDKVCRGSCVHSDHWPSLRVRAASMIRDASHDPSADCSRKL